MLKMFAALGMGAILPDRKSLNTARAFGFPTVPEKWVSYLAQGYDHKQQTDLCAHLFCNGNYADAHQFFQDTLGKDAADNAEALYMSERQFGLDSFTSGDYRVASNVFFFLIERYENSIPPPELNFITEMMTLSTYAHDVAIGTKDVGEFLIDMGDRREKLRKEAEGNGQDLFSYNHWGVLDAKLDELCARFAPDLVNGKDV